MKKNLLIVLLFIFFNVLSQSYTPLLKEGNKWWVYYREGYCDFCNPQYRAYYIFINGETVVDNVVYKRIYSNLYRNCPYMGSCTNPTNPDVFECLMREDLITKKVYFLDSNTNTEKLIYDFSAQAGDVLDVYWRWGGEGYPTAIDDIVYGSVFGKENVKTFVSGYHNIYEGIGSQSGLFTRPAGLPFEVGAFWLDCFEDTTGKSCVSQFVVLGTSENSTEKNLTLYYSKENQDFKILGSPSQDYKVSFYEATGRLSEEVDTKGKQNFSLRNIVKNEILFYTIKSEGRIWKGKVIIQ